jgi:hypothetical protein
MENLQSFGVQQLSIEEINNIQGGANPIKDYVIGALIEVTVDFMFSGWDAYGAYAYEHQSSSGGLKW